MSHPPQPDPLAVILLGPTASGKTALSLTLAEKFSGEIVSCDSVAVYREMEIGTAKPSLAERARIPHHLIDVYSPAEHSTAGDYSRLARAALHDIAARHHLPIVTGGTGLYLRALTDGLFAGPQRSPDLRARLERSARATRPGWLHRILTRLDPASAARIHANDMPKLIRAIEVSLAARQPLSEAWKSGRDPLTGFRLLRIGLDPDRKALYARINARAKEMFAPETGNGGLLDETRHLISKYGKTPGNQSWPLRLPRIQAGPSRAARRNDPARSHRFRPAGTPQLRQASAHLVPPRTRRPLAPRLRRRPRHHRGGGRRSRRNTAITLALTARSPS